MLVAWDEEPAEEPVEIDEVQEEEEEEEVGRRAAAPWAAVEVLEEAEGEGLRVREGS